MANSRRDAIRTVAKTATLAEDVAAGMVTADQLAADAELARLRSEVATYQKRYKAALAQIDRERERGDALVSLKGIAARHAKPPKQTKQTKHDATMVVLLSDIHCEETVRPETVNGLNAFDLDVCSSDLAMEKRGWQIPGETQFARWLKQRH